MRAWFLRVRDQMAGSDPGGNRLRMGVSGGVSIATALGLQYVIARVAHADMQSQIIAMLLGAMVAMMGSMALNSGGAWSKVRTAAPFPVAFGVGMAAGVAVGGHTDLMLSVFVLVMFASVIVRRFGPPFFIYGFQLWMGYFFASFTHATVSTLPSLLLTVVTSSIWVALLSITVLRTNPRRAVARTRLAFEARARDVARASAALLEAAVTDPSQVARWRRRLTGRQARLNEAALMIEAWSAEPGAVPASRSATALRRHLLDAQLAIDGLAAAAGELAGSRNTAQLLEAAGIAGLLAGREYAAADRAARELLSRIESTAAEGTVGTAESDRAARRVAAAAAEFAAVVRTVREPLSTADAEEFLPAVTLAMGNLPGSAAFASQVAARGHRWNPLARLDFISRQAFQAAVAGGLAILVGREISTTRYYWAVLAAFIAFSGTATRSETSIKAINRVVGTLVGLFAGLALARATAGHTAWIVAVVVLSMAFGLYLMRISYRYMIFFITIMLAQLYSVLHELSDGLLMLRLEETAVGAGIGIVVALVLAPLSTRDVVATVRRNVLTALGDLLRAAAGQLDASPEHSPAGTADRPDGAADRSGDGSPDLDGLIRAVDLRMYQLTLAAAPLTRPFLWGNSPSRTRHLLNLYSSTAYYARSLASAVRQPVPSAAAAAASRALAEAVAALAGTETVGASPAAGAGGPAPGTGMPGTGTAGTGTAGTGTAGTGTAGTGTAGTGTAGTGTAGTGTAGTGTAGTGTAGTGTAGTGTAGTGTAGTATAGTATAGTATVGDEIQTPEQARRSALAHLDAADAALFAKLQPPSVKDAKLPVVRALVHLQQLLRELATFGQPAGPDPGTGAERSSAAPADPEYAPAVSRPGHAEPGAGVNGSSANGSTVAGSALTGPAPTSSAPTGSTVDGPVTNGSHVDGSHVDGSALAGAPAAGSRSGPTVPGCAVSSHPLSGSTAPSPTGSGSGSGSGGAGTSVASTAPNGAPWPSGPVSHRAGERKGMSSPGAETEDGAGGPVIYPRHAVSADGDAQVHRHRRRRRGLSRHAR